MSEGRYAYPHIFAMEPINVPPLRSFLINFEADTENTGVSGNTSRAPKIRVGHLLLRDSTLVRTSPHSAVKGLLHGVRELAQSGQLHGRDKMLRSILT